MEQFTLSAIRIGVAAQTYTVHECKNAAEAYEQAHVIFQADAAVSAVEVWRLDGLLFTVR